MPRRQGTSAFSSATMIPKRPSDMTESTVMEAKISGIKLVIADDDKIAEPFLTRHEFGNDGANHRESDGGLETGEQVRDRVRQQDLAKLGESLHTHRLGQVQHVGVDLGKSHNRIDDHWKKGNEKNDHDLGPEAVDPEPDQEQRCNGDPGNRSDNDQGRINRKPEKP